MCEHVCWFPGAAGTKHHKADGFSHQNVFSQRWSPGSEREVSLPPRPGEGNPCPSAWDLWPRRSSLLLLPVSLSPHDIVLTGA